MSTLAEVTSKLKEYFTKSSDISKSNNFDIQTLKIDVRELANTAFNPNSVLSQGQMVARRDAYDTAVAVNRSVDIAKMTRADFYNKASAEYEISKSRTDYLKAALDTLEGLK